MNYYNPYMSFFPYASTPAKTGLFSTLFKSGKFNLGSIISGTQKTLSMINQAIPVIKQVSPVIKNAKTMFKVMNEFKKTDTPKNNKTVVQTIKSSSSQTTFQDENISYDQTNNNGPTFFI